MTTRFDPPIQTLPDGYSSYNKYTAGVFHAYADSSRPDDSGDGLSWLTAKKTLAAAVAVLPDVAEDHVVLHLKGSFDISGETIYIKTAISGTSKRFIIDGGDDVTIVDGPYTATSTTTTSITDLARSWTVNAMRGYTVEILDGAAAGYAYPVQSNTADTITVGKTWVVPGLCQFRIVRPATSIVAGSQSWFYFLGTSLFGWMAFQRLFINGTISFGVGQGATQISIFGLAGIVSEGASLVLLPVSVNSSFEYRTIDPDDPSSYLDYSKRRLAFCTRSTSSNVVLGQQSGMFTLRGPSVINGTISATGLAKVSIQSGCFVKKLLVRGVNSVELGVSDSYGTQSIIGESADVGIDAGDSRIVVSKNFVIQNCGSHAIQLDNSVLECQSAVLSGSGNVGAGIYLKNKASVLIADGYTPTLTGTVGNYSFDGATDGGTWAEVDGGTPVADLTRFCNVVEVA